MQYTAGLWKLLKIYVFSSGPDPRNPPNRPGKAAPGPQNIVEHPMKSLIFEAGVGGPVGHPQGIQGKAPSKSQPRILGRVRRPLGGTKPTTSGSDQKSTPNCTQGQNISYDSSSLRIRAGIGPKSQIHLGKCKSGPSPAGGRGDTKTLKSVLKYSWEKVGDHAPHIFGRVRRPLGGTEPRSSGSGRDPLQQMPRTRVSSPVTSRQWVSLREIPESSILRKT